MIEVQDVYEVKRVVMLVEPLGWKLVEVWSFGGDVLVQFTKPEAKSATEVVTPYPVG